MTVQRTEVGLDIASSQIRAHGLDRLVALRDAGLEISGFTVRSPTLDDVFFVITDEKTEAPTQDCETLLPDQEGFQ